MPPKEPPTVVPFKPAPLPLLEPPEYLTEEECKIWRGAVEGMRRDSVFTEAVAPLLETYVTTVAMAFVVARELRATSIGDKAWFRLMKEQCRLSRMMSTLATTLRLVPRRSRRGENYAA
jgi:hypothetical protein